MTDGLDRLLRDVYKEGYYRTAYEVQNGFKAYFDTAKIDDDLLKTLMSKPWADDGSAFSERIWGKYRPTLVNKLHKHLSECVMRGENPKKVVKLFTDDFNAAHNAANRLVFTEYSYFNALSVKNSFDDLGVEEFEVCETLDSKTCDTCADMDGEHYPMKDFDIGLNAPPFHPYCRGTVIPYFDDKSGMRAARDEEGKTYYTEDMSYKEWKEKFIKEKGQTAWNVYEKSAKNATADKEQFENYKAVLGAENVPKSLDEFQKLKYTDGEDWADLKYYYRNIAGRPIEYVKIDRELQKWGITKKGNAYPIEDLEIKGWREHAEKRLIERNISRDEALNYKNNAVVIMKKYSGENEQFNYYSDNGVIGIMGSKGIVLTVYSKNEFLSDTFKILEVAKKWLK